MKAPIAWRAIGWHVDARVLPPKRRYWLSDAWIPAAATFGCRVGHSGSGGAGRTLRNHVAWTRAGLSLTCAMQRTSN